MPLTVNAHDLLADRRASARDDARLRDGRTRRVADKSCRIDGVFPEHGAERIAARIRPADANGIRTPAERRCIVRHIRRAAGHNALLPLLQNEHGCLTRDACDRPVEIDIRHHIPDDEHGGIF